MSAEGLMSTVAWTELHQAIVDDGLDLRDSKCGPAVTAWLRKNVVAANDYKRANMDAQDALHDLANTHREPAAVAFAQALLDKLMRLHTTPASVPDGFRAFPDQAPAPDTQCVVLTEFNGRLHPSVDTWEMQRESPVEWSSATVETGYFWSENNDVLYWKPVGELPAYPTNQEGTAP